MAPIRALTPYRQAGYSVYLDTDDEGIYDEVAGLGRHNHENTVIVPGGWDGVASLSGDDTFDAPSSQLYLHLSDSLEALKADEGTLYGFRVTATDEGDLDDPTDAFNGANDYHEINVGDTWSGEFIPVPDDVARGTTGVAPQKALEDWSNANNVFQFIRVEDIAYDPDDPNVVYFADTGERRALPDSVWTTLDTRGGTVDRSATGRLHRALDRVPATGTPEVWPADPNGVHARGRVFRMELNADDPTVVDSFSVVHDADTTMADGSDVHAQPRQPRRRHDQPDGPGGRQQRQDLAVHPRHGCLADRGRRHASHRAGGRGVERDHRHVPMDRRGLVGSRRPVPREPAGNAGTVHVHRPDQRGADHVQHAEGRRSAPADVRPGQLMLARKTASIEPLKSRPTIRPKRGEEPGAGRPAPTLPLLVPVAGSVRPNLPDVVDEGQHGHQDDPQEEKRERIGDNEDDGPDGGHDQAQPKE